MNSILISEPLPVVAEATEATPILEEVQEPKKETPEAIIEESKNTDKEANDEEEYDINAHLIDEIEEFVDVMFSKLKNKKLSIRELAGRGLATVCSNLSSDMTDEICSALLSLVEEDEEEDMNLLHGVCLALGELLNRGLVQPEWLERIIPILLKSLLFEDVRGNYAGGTVVRDAGCYICWAFARGFESEVLKPHVQELATELLLTAMFDIQGNCRRAAAAAFQENVGRQGNFPNGIAIVSEMDYFTVGLESNSFIHIAPFVAGFPEYTRRILDHLALNRLWHVNEKTRMLAARSFGLVSLLDPEYSIQTLLPKILKQATSRLVRLRHGSLIGIGSLLVALSGRSDVLIARQEKEDSIFLQTLKINERKLVSHGEYLEKFLKTFEPLKLENKLGLVSSEKISQILDVLEVIESKGMHMGAGAELTRVGLCFLAESLAFSRIELTIERKVSFMKFFENCVRATVERIQLQAALSLNSFSEFYMNQAPDDPVYSEYVRGYLRRFKKEMLLHIKVSYANAMASLPAKYLEKFKDEIFPVLLANSVPSKKVGNNDPEVRKAVLKTLSLILKKIGLDKFSKEQILELEKTLLKTGKDYKLDKRGDIGCIVREETMNVVFELLCLATAEKRESKTGQIEEEKTEKEETVSCLEYLNLQGLISLFATQILHPNDRMRLRSGYLMQKMIEIVFPFLPDFESKQVLCTYFESVRLRAKFEEHQNAFFDQYDVSLLDDKKFLSYNENVDFVFFWNVPQCAFNYLAPLLKEKSLRVPLLTGCLLSAACSVKALSETATDAVTKYLSSLETPESFVNDCLKLLSSFKRKEKFAVAVFNALRMLFSDHMLVNSPERKTLVSRILKALNKETGKSKSISKLQSAAVLLVTLLGAFEQVPSDFMISEVLPLIDRFLFSEYPIIRKAFSEEFYMWLITSGSQVYDDEQLEMVSESLANLQFDDLNAEEHEEFQTMWQMLNMDLISP